MFLSHSECIQYQGEECYGDVEFFSPAGLGGPLRCEYHRDLRMRSYMNSIERYANSDVAPAWFDEMNCGERWNED